MHLNNHQTNNSLYAFTEKFASDVNKSDTANCSNLQSVGLIAIDISSLWSLNQCTILFFHGEGQDLFSISIIFDLYCAGNIKTVDCSLYNCTLCSTELWSIDSSYIDCRVSTISYQTIGRNPFRMIRITYVALPRTSRTEEENVLHFYNHTYQPTRTASTKWRWTVERAEITSALPLRWRNP